VHDARILRVNSRANIAFCDFLVYWLYLFSAPVAARHLATFLCKHAKRFHRDIVMIYLTAIVSLLLFIYLFVALIRPEWF